MNDNEVFITILEWMIKQAKNKTYIKHLNIMLDKIEHKCHIEEQDHPRYQSIQFGYWNLFNLSDNDYRKIAFRTFSASVSSKSFMICQTVLLTLFSLVQISST